MAGVVRVQGPVTSSSLPEEQPVYNQKHGCDLTQAHNPRTPRAILSAQTSSFMGWEGGSQLSL